jgi:hypothetical protein
MQPSDWVHQPTATMTTLSKAAVAAAAGTAAVQEFTKSQEALIGTVEQVEDHRLFTALQGIHTIPMQLIQVVSIASQIIAEKQEQQLITIK